MPDTCIGWVEHRWTLTIEEGQIGVHTDPCSPDCPPSLLGLGDMQEWLTMAPLAVTVSMATECPAYDVDEDCVPLGKAKPMKGYESGSHYIAHGTRCDCNWWPVLRLVKETVGV